MKKLLLLASIFPGNFKILIISFLTISGMSFGQCPDSILSSALTAPPVCSGTVFNYTATSATAGATFSWSRATVSGIFEAGTSGTGNVSETLTNTTTSPIVVTYVYTTSVIGCSGTPQNVSVTINPSPALNSPLTAPAVCSGTAFNYTATSATAGATFSWSRATFGGITPAGTSGTGDVSETLTTILPLPKLVTYVYTTAANGCSGIAQNVTVTVGPSTGFLLGSTLSPSGVCSGNVFNYTATSIALGATFSWSRATVSGISPSGTSGTGNVSETLTNTTTSPKIVTYVYTTTAVGCSGTPQNVNVQIFPRPVLSSPLTAPAVCSGTAFNYTATSTTSAANFFWSRATVSGITPAGTSGTGNVSETLTNTTTSPVVVTYVYTPAFIGCSGTAQNVNVTINPSPALSSALTAPAVCGGTAFNYTPTSAASGATFSWSRAAVTGISQVASSGTGSISEVLTNTTAAPTNVTYAVTTTANSCSGSPQNVTVTVSPAGGLLLNSTLSPSAVCSGTSFNYTATSAIAGATFSWSRGTMSGISQAGTSGTGDVSETLTNTTASPIVVTYVYTTSVIGCSGTPQNVSVTINPSPALNSPLTAPAVCSGTAFNYTATSATAGATFSWSRATISGITPTGTSGTGNVSETLTNTTASPIVVTYVYTTSAIGCSGTAQNVNVTINPSPALSSTLTAAVCSGATFNYTATSATAGATFSWSRATVSGITPTGTSGTGNVSETLTNTTASPIVLTYVYTTSAIGCSGTAQNVNVTINPSPALSSTLTVPTVCSGTAFNYTPTSAVSGATFSWSRATVSGISPAGTSGTGDVNETLTNTTASPIVVTYVYTTTANGCSGIAQNVTATVSGPPSTLFLTSPLAPPVCSGTVFNYTATSATAGATFSWSRATVSGIFEAGTSGTGNVSETLTNTTTSPIVVTYVYTTSVIGCSGTPQNVSVTINPSPALNSPLTAPAVCSGTAFNYTATSATAGATFSWSRATFGGITPAGTSGTGDVSETLTTILPLPKLVTYVYTTAANGCSGIAQNVTVTVGPSTGFLLGSTLSPSGVCSGNVFNYTATSIALGATFSWSRATVSGISPSGTSGTGNVSETLTNTTTSPKIVTYVYTTTAVGCSGTPQNVNVQIFPRPVLSSPLTAPAVCSGTAFNYTATSTTSAANFFWSRATVSGITPAGTSGTGNVSETLTNTTTSPVVVTYVYTPAFIGCSGTAQNVNVTINPSPALSSALTAPAVCGGTAFNYTPTSAASGATFSWSRAAVTGISQVASSGTGSISEVLTNTTAAPINVTYAVTTTANSCSGSPQNVVVTVNPIPALSSTLSPVAICSGTTFGYAPTSATAGATFSWSRAAVTGISQGASSGTGNISEVLTNTTTAPINVTYVITTTANSCSGSPQNVVVTVNPTPTLSSTLSPAAICSGATFGYTPTSAVSGATFLWSRALITGISQSASSGTGSISEVLTNTTTAAINVTYAITTTANSCSGSPQNVVLAVNPPTSIPSQSTAAQTVCLNGTLSTMSVTAGGTAPFTHQWYSNTTSSNSGGTLIGGATASSYTPSSATVGVTYYYAVVSGACGTAATSAVSGAVTVNPPTSISFQSTTAQTVCLNGTSSATSVTAGGTAPFTYQWYSNSISSNSGGTLIGGAIASSYTPSSATVGTTYYYVVVSSACGASVTSAVSGAITVNPPTSISSQSTTAQTVCLNGTLSAMSVTAAGTAPFMYQWYSNTTSSNSGGTLISGATASSYTPSSATVGTTYYYVVVSGACGAAVTSAISGAITINPPTSISSQSTTAQTVCLNGTLSAMSVTAGGTAPFTYQWYSNITSSNSGGTLIGGATASSFTPLSTTAGTKYYYVVVSGACGAAVTSAVSGAITVNAPTSILSQSTHAQTVCLDGTLSAMSIAASGTAPFAYQWYSNTTSSNSGGTLISGAISSTYTPSSGTAGVTYYYAVVSGACGSAVTSAVSGTITVNAPTSISSQSAAAQAVCLNGTLSAMSVTAGGTAPFAYQWYSNTTSSNSGGTLISGPTSSSYTPSSATVGTTYYYVVVSGACGAVTSAVSDAITINTPTSISSQSTAAQTVCLNATLSAMTVTPDGTAPFSYQWYTNSTSSNSGGTFNGVTTSTYTPSSATVGITYYYVTVAGACGATVTSSVSEAVTVNPLPTPTITSSSSTTFCQGGSVTLTASSASSYLWSTGATTQAITVNANGDYSVTVTNSNNCSATSNPTAITISPLPTVTVSPSSATTCSTGVSLTASGASAYYWSPSTGLSATTGATVTANPTATTTYTVTGTTASGCQSTTNVTITVSTTCNEALSFNGTSYVSIETNGKLNLGIGSFTIEVYLKLTASNSVSTILSRRTTASGSTSDGFLFGFFGGSPFLQLAGSPNIQPASGSLNLFDGNCHHVAVRRDGTTISFFVDGNFVSNGNSTSDRNITSFGALRVANDLPSGSYFSGWIGEIRIWNTALTDAQIQSNLGINLFPQANLNLLMYYDMKDVAGSQTLTDLSETGGSDGTLGSSAGVDSFDPTWLTKSQVTCSVGGNFRVEWLPGEEHVSSDSVRDISNEVKVYPNPATKSFYLELPEPIKETTPIHFINAIGNSVMETTITQGETTKMIFVEQLTNGIYILQLITPHGYVRKKIIVLKN